MPRAPRVKSTSSSNHARSTSPQPTTSEESLECGISTEERAERLAYGIKSCKAFEKALEYYHLAIRLDDDELKADAYYNAARVYYVLGSSFYLPAEKVKAYTSAVECYRLALQEQRTGETDFGLDINSNLAAALHGLVKVGVDFPFLLQCMNLIQVGQEAVTLLEGVASEQEVVLSAQLQDEQGILSGSQPPNQGSATPLDIPGDGGPSRSEYTSSLIVPSSLLDTYHTIHALYSDLLALTSTPQETLQLQHQLSAILSKATQFISTCNATNDWGERASPDDDWSTGVSELQRADIEGRVSILSRLLEQGENISQDLQLISQQHLRTLQQMTQSKDSLSHQSRQLSETRKRTFWTTKVDEMISASDQGVQLAILLLRINPPEDLVRLSWSLATTSSQLYLLAVSLLDSSSASSGSAVVLGTSESVNATTLLRCQIYTNLSDVNILRSHTLYTTLTNPRVVDDKSRSTITSNAKIYATRGLTQVGLHSWLTTCIFTSKNAQGTKREIPPGGWDALETQSDAILTYLRSIYHNGATEEVEKVCKSIRYLTSRTSTQDMDTLIQGWKLGLDIDRWCNALIEAEGEGIVTLQERQFWMNVKGLVVQGS